MRLNTGRPGHEKIDAAAAHRGIFKGRRQPDLTREDSQFRRIRQVYAPRLDLVRVELALPGDVWRWLQQTAAEAGRV